MDSRSLDATLDSAETEEDISLGQCTIMSSLFTTTDVESLSTAPTYFSTFTKHQENRFNDNDEDVRASSTSGDSDIFTAPATLPHNPNTTDDFASIVSRHSPPSAYFGVFTKFLDKNIGDIMRIDAVVPSSTDCGSTHTTSNDDDDDDVNDHADADAAMGPATLKQPDHQPKQPKKKTVAEKENPVQYEDFLFSFYTNRSPYKECSICPRFVREAPGWMRKVMIVTAYLLVLCICLGITGLLLFLHRANKQSSDLGSESASDVLLRRGGGGADDGAIPYEAIPSVNARDGPTDIFTDAPP